MMTIKEYINEYHAHLNECRKKLKKLNDEFCKSNVKFVKVGDVIASTKFAIIVDHIVAITNTDYNNYDDYYAEELLTKDFDDYDDDFDDSFFDDDTEASDEDKKDEE